MGIVTGISIPLIRNVKSAQEKKQYETYRSSLSYATKVYVDSFSEDLFGHDEIACATVSYNQLKSKNLIKDILISGVSCASNDTYIRVVKFEGHYSYFSKITCGSLKVDGTISKNIEILGGGADTLQKAFDKAKSGATLTLTKSYFDGYAGTDKTLTINLNGKKITESNHIQRTGNLTITGNGTIVTSATALSAYGKLTILNGTYETTNTCGHAVEVLGGTSECLKDR